MHNTSQTSVEHYKTLNAAGQYDLIRWAMRQNPERDWCIADMAAALDFEKSTMSARFNELREFGELEFTEQKLSRSTGIRSNHYKLKLQPSLI